MNARLQNLRNWFLLMSIRLRWHWQFQSEQFGNTGIVVLLAAFAMLMYLILVLVPSQRSLEIQIQSLNEKLKLSHATKNKLSLDVSKANELVTDINHRKWMVVNEMQKSGLLVVQANYRIEPLINEKLYRTTIELTATGSYLNLSSALAQLQKDTMLRLESMFLDRPSYDTDLLKIKMQLSLLKVEN